MPTGDIKTRKVRQKDWDSIQKYIKDELDSRKNSQFRKSHEKIWKEVDRQLKMEAMSRVNQAGQEMPPSWNSAFELGELSKTSEVITADVMRITFPAERDWFECHVEVEPQITEEGPVPNEEAQSQLDGQLRSLLAQQHRDFGFKRRFELSVKEALHHGSFVAEIAQEQEMMVEGGSKVKEISAPVWIPHSMWNCYPDPSPRVIGTNMFYSGSMIIESYMPRYKLERMKGEGWMPSRFDKIPKQEGDKENKKDIKLVTYYGDIAIDRGDGDIFLPNSKAILANGIIVFWDSNELPYPSVIFGGYEKQDVRDPYHTSPLIKQSPIQKLASILANKFVDAIALKTEPPIVYDGNDPYFVASDGPVIAPGVKTPTKGSTAYTPIEIGDPSWALEGLQMTLRQMQEGTGVSAIRTGIPNSDRQTATEVQKTAQGAEVRTIDFIDKLNWNLTSYLYMQHALNLKHLKRYAFYSEEMNSHDFVRVSSEDYKLTESCHFDVVGARGLLGEEQRKLQMTNVTAFASGNPLFAPLLKPTDLLLEMYRDAGTKNPERFVQVTDEREKMMQEFQASMQEMQGMYEQQMSELAAELEKAEAGEEIKVLEIQEEARKAADELKFKYTELVAKYSTEAQKLAIQRSAGPTQGNA